MSLSSEGRNAFYDADDPFFLSPQARAFIAGHLRHARELRAIFAQWVNSYKRLVPGGGLRLDEDELSRLEQAA